MENESIAYKNKIEERRILLALKYKEIIARTLFSPVADCREIQKWLDCLKKVNSYSFEELESMANL